MFIKLLTLQCQLEAQRFYYCLTKVISFDHPESVLKAPLIQSSDLITQSNRLNT
jgi:hypothetical protein